jgi:hypothetical protein
MPPQKILDHVPLYKNLTKELIEKILGKNTSKGNYKKKLGKGTY